MFYLIKPNLSVEDMTMVCILLWLGQYSFEVYFISNGSGTVAARVRSS